MNFQIRIISYEHCLDCDALLTKLGIDTSELEPTDEGSIKVINGVAKTGLRSNDLLHLSMGSLYCERIIKQIQN